MTNFSVCIAAYNAEKYINECIKSVLNQTFSNYELIIVDDGSIDKTGVILDEFSKENERIRVFHNDGNKGPLFSKVKAINNSSGEYLMFMDADDYYEKITLETVDKLIDEYNPDLVMFSFRKVFGNKKEDKIGLNTVNIYDEKNRNEFLKKVLSESKYNTIWSKAVKAELIRNKLEIPQNDYLEVRRGDDHYISLEIYKKAKRIIETEQILYNYRINDEGLTKTQKKQYNFHYRCREKTVELIESEKCLSEKEKKELFKQTIHKFINQIEEISNFEIEKEKKIDIFNKIKDSSYYKKHVLQNMHFYNNSPKIYLFRNNKYKLLILLCEIENHIYRLLGK